MYFSIWVQDSIENVALARVGATFLASRSATILTLYTDGRGGMYFSIWVQDSIENVALA